MFAIATTSLQNCSEWKLNLKNQSKEKSGFETFKRRKLNVMINENHQIGNLVLNIPQQVSFRILCKALR
jgi:hypothetical protein